MVIHRTGRFLLGIAILGGGYYGLAKAGNVVSFTGGVQAVWLPVGWAVGFLYIFGLRYWIGALAADALLGILSSESAVTQLMQTAGNMAEVLVAAALARRLLGHATRLNTIDELGRFLGAMALGTTISAPIGTASLVRAGDIGWSDAPVVWRTWWLGDTCGAVVLASVLLVWRHVRVGTASRARTLEAVTVGAVVLALSYAGFRDSHPITYVVFPGLIWAALRFGVAGASAAGMLAALTAVAFTAHHRGPFVVSSIDDTILSVQLYALVAVVTSLALGVVVDARRVAMLELEQSRRREAEQAENERQRIARDLHDSVSQSLFSLTLQARTAAHLVDTGGAGVAQPILEMRQLADDALAELRTVIFDLRPDASVAPGLVATLTAQGAALSTERSVRITVTGPPKLTLDPGVEQHVYRIAREAMANAATHACAQVITVSCAVEGRTFVLTVADDGTGFDPQRAYPGHLGLETMRSRASEIGATLEIASDARGTSVTVRVPVAGVRRPGRSPVRFGATRWRRERLRVDQ